MIHHVQLACPAGSENTLRDFYGGVLGFEEVARHDKRLYRFVGVASVGCHRTVRSSLPPQGDNPPLSEFGTAVACLFAAGHMRRHSAMGHRWDATKGQWIDK